MEKTNSNPAPKNSKNDPAKIILISAIIILLVAISYLVFNNQSNLEQIQKHAKTHTEDSSKIAQKIAELNELQKHYNHLKEEKNSLGLENDSLEARIAELEVLKEQLRKRVITISNVNTRLLKSQSDFIRIRENYDSLITANAQLRNQRDSLFSASLVKDDTIANLSSLKKDLAEKVAIASVLKAENIKVSVLTGKGKELVSNVYKVKAVNKVKVCFNISDNKVARKNSKEIYFKLIEPSGSTLFEGEKTFQLEGRESFYTDVQKIDFDNSKQQVTFLYAKGSQYKPGKYTIELFSEGNKIGDSQLVLK